MATITMYASVEAGYVQESGSLCGVTAVRKDSSGEKFEGGENADC